MIAQYMTKMPSALAEVSNTFRRMRKVLDMPPVRRVRT